MIRAFWDRTFFPDTELAGLAVARMVMVGFALLSSLPLEVVTDLVASGGETYHPIPAMRVLLPLAGFVRPGVPLVTALHGVLLISGVAALVGWRGRWSLPVFAFTYVFRQVNFSSYGPEVHHGETMVAFFLVFLALSPSTEVLSMDHLRQRLAETRQKGRFVPESLWTRTDPFARWPLLTMQILLSLAYFSAFLAKVWIKGGWRWANGYTLQYDLATDGIRWGRPLGLWLSQQHTLAILLSVLTLAFEALFFLTLFRKWLIPLFVVSGAAFHTGIYITQQAPFFGFIAAYVALVNVQDLRTWLRRRGAWRLPRRLLIYDGRCGACRGMATLVQTLNWPGNVDYLDLEAPVASLEGMEKKTSVRPATGGPFSLVAGAARGRNVLRNFAWTLPMAWPLLPFLWLPGVAGLCGGCLERRWLSSRSPQVPDPCQIGHAGPLLR